MINEFTLGNTYYFRYVIGSSDEDFLLTFIGGMGDTRNQLRINGGSWTSYLLGLTFRCVSGVFSLLTGGIPPTITTGDVIEIYGELQYKSGDASVLYNVTLENPDVFNLYQLKCEDNMVGKGGTGMMSLYDNVYGKLREETNILTPSILFQYESFPEFNYLYLPKFKRYYFVTNITCVRNNVYRVDLKVDVLYTFETDIRGQNAFISRGGSAIAGRIDERLPLNKVPNIVTTKMTSYDTNRHFNSDQNDATKYNIVLCVLQSHALSIFAGTKQNLTDTDLPSVANLLGHSPSITAYAITMNDWKTICDLLLNDDTLGTYIVSVHMYPFGVNNDAFVSAGLKAISLGATSTGVSGYIMQGYSSQYSLYSTISITKRFSGDEYDFLNYEPYTKYEMFIPYHSWVPLEGKKILGKTLHLYYIHNYLTGVSMAFIYNSTDKIILDSYQVNVGIALSISTTNNRENENQRDSNMLNMIMGMIGGGVQIASGVASDKLGGIFGGALGMAKAFMGKINADMFIYDKGNTILNGELLGAYTFTDSYIRETYYQYDVNNVSYFRNTNGYKWDICSDLSSLSGYTEIPELHYTPSSQKYITKTEIDEIVSLARNGIIL